MHQSPAGATSASASVASGRFEWEANGEAQYVQFLPPYMADMSAPAEVIVRQMDYAGVDYGGAAERSHLRRPRRGVCRGDVHDILGGSSAWRSCRRRGPFAMIS